MSRPPKRISQWLGVILSVSVLVLAVVAALTSGWWWSSLQSILAKAPPQPLAENTASDPGDDHADDHDHDHADGDTHDHDHADHDDHEEFPEIELSDSAIQTIGLKSQELKHRDFEKTITVPAMIVERPGRSRLQITAHFSGKITRVYPVVGETVKPGEPLFHLHLTHEELVHNQTDLLEAIQNLKIVESELARLNSIAAEGIVAGKTLLEQKYDQQKLEATIHTLRQALTMHGLSEAQVDSIVKDGKLLQGIDIEVPTGEEQPGNPDTLWQVQSLGVDQGEHIEVGHSMCVLVDYADLYIEGTAFEQDAAALHAAAAAKAKLTAVLAIPGREPQFIPNLELVYIANLIDPNERTLKFYVRLPNRIVNDTTTPEGHRFVSWQYKPGERLQLQIPVEKWTNRMVVPASAIVQEGPESYAFEQHTNHFHRVPVAVEYRDPYWVVLAEKNHLEPGDKVVTFGAENLNLALKQKQSGGSNDPHQHHHH